MIAPVTIPYNSYAPYRQMVTAGSKYPMLVQIYEVTSPDEANALAKIGVDHIGVLVGEGEFPREQPVEMTKRIFSAIPRSCRASALSLSANLNAIEHVITTLAPFNPAPWSIN